MRTLGLAVALVLVARVAAAEPTDAERYYNEGQTAYDAKRYDDAIAAWSKSYALSHLPGLIYNLAQAHRLRGDCQEAVEAYKRFVALDSTSPQRASAEDFVRDLEPCPSSVGHEPVTPPLTPPTPSPSLSPASSPHPVAQTRSHAAERNVGIAILGAGAAATAVGVYFGSESQLLASQVRTACTSSCTWDSIKSKDQQGRSDEQMQYVMYGVGGAAIVTGAVLVVLSRRHVEVPISAAPVRGGAALTWSHVW